MMGEFVQSSTVALLVLGFEVADWTLADSSVLCDE